MKQVYRVLAYAIAGGVMLQAAWIGLGNFTMFNKIDDGLVIDKDYDGNFGQSMHWVFGMMVIPLLVILLLIVSFFAKVDRGSRWAGFVFLAVVLQIVLAFVAFGVPAVGFLHPLNAFVVLGLASYAGHRVNTTAEDRVAVAA